MYLEKAKQYCNDVLAGNIPACVFNKQACQRFLNALENPLYIYKAEKANQIINFVQEFYLTETQPPRKTVLHGWQLVLVCSLYGIYKKDTDTKLYRSAYIEVGRGNAKTQTVALLSIFELVMGNDAQIILSANTNKQVMEVDFDKVKKLILQIDPKKKYFKIFYNKITYGTNKLIITSNESQQLDGLSGSFMVVDEMHLMKDLSVYNSLKSSMVKRNDNTLFIITTAGEDINSECHKMRKYCEKILDGTFSNESQFTMIFTIDEGDDYTNPKNWMKPNPMLGISVYADAIESEVTKSVQNESEKQSVLSRHFNVWARKNEQDAYVHDKYVQQALTDIRIDDPMFKGCEVIVGADLSINDDISSITYFILKDDIYYFFNDYYICSEALTTKRNKERYKEAAKNGYIKIIEGKAIDYQVIIDDLKLRNIVNNIRLVAFDKYNASDFVKKLDAEGFYLCRISQLASGLNAPLRELQRLFLLNKVRLANNPITVWMFGNVKTKMGFTGLICLDKSGNEADKIDGVASLADALAGYLIAPEYGFNIW